jgi:cytochrome oxidase Cu insertion factor (SCO1/SenC/PrrC family)
MPLTPAARRGLIVFAGGLVVIAIVLVGEYFLLTGPESPLGQRLGAVEPPVPVAIGGDFTLVDQTGATRLAADFRGKLMLVYFGYTSCPDVCPTELQKMSEAIDLLDAKGDAVQPIFITVDPQRDTVEQMQDYAANFHPRLVALTGSAEQIAVAARAYRVFYQPVKQPDGSYLMDHSSVVYLMARDGSYLAHFGSESDAAQIAAAIAKKL